MCFVHVLQDSLGGSAYSCMIVNVAPEERYYLDTVATLKLARKSKKIVNNVIVHEDVVSKLWLLQLMLSSTSLLCINVLCTYITELETEYNLTYLYAQLGCVAVCTSMSVHLIIRPKCMLATSLAAPW